jgi:hypothetical protein
MRIGKQSNRGDGLAFARGRKATGTAFGPFLRLLAFTAIGCTAATAAIWMYPHAGARGPAADSPAPGEPQRTAVAAVANLAAPVRTTSIPPAAREAPLSRATGASPSAEAARPMPLGPQTSGTIANLPAVALPLAPVSVPAVAPPVTAPVAAAAAASATQALPAMAAPAIASSAKTPTECLPAEFKTLIREIEARFGSVTLVSTTTLHTNNHGTGSTRHKLHTDCKAVDFKVAGDVNALTTFLRSRPEVGGINTFRNNGVIHIDYNERRRAAARN